MIKDIFKYYSTTENNVLNIFDEIDFSDILTSDLYELYNPNDSDNLMLISNKFYRNIHDWWILYIFNQLNDCMFGIIPKKVIDIIISEYKNNIINYDNLSNEDKDIIEELVRYYFSHSYDIDIASKKTLETLNDIYARSNPIFLNDFDYTMTASIINKVVGLKQLKIPSLQIVMLMKQRMKNYLKKHEELNI